MRKSWLLSALCLLLVIGCSKGGTGTGNPGLTIASRGYNSAVASNRLLDLAVPSAVASTTSISSLSFCVTELKFITDNGSVIAVPESQLGLVDLGDGSSTVTWGRLTAVAPGTVVSHVFVEIEHNSALCAGATYSVSANGQKITAELEFKFALGAPFTVGNSGSVTFNLATLASKINQALLDGKFNDTYIGDYIDGSFEDTAIGLDND